MAKANTGLTTELMERAISTHLATLRENDVAATVHEKRYTTWDAISSGGSLSRVSTGGMRVSPHLAENLTTVMACVNAIAGSIATLPLSVYRIEAEARTSVPGHAVARMVRRGRAPRRRGSPVGVSPIRIDVDRSGS